MTSGTLKYLKQPLHIKNKHIIKAHFTIANSFHFLANKTWWKWILSGLTMATLEFNRFSITLNISISGSARNHTMLIGEMDGILCVWVISIVIQYTMNPAKELPISPINTILRFLFFLIWGILNIMKPKKEPNKIAATTQRYIDLRPSVTEAAVKLV